MITCVHGFYEADIPATLMVFKYQLPSNKDGHEFKPVYTDFVFQEASGSAEKFVPNVVGYAPF